MTARPTAIVIWLLAAIASGSCAKGRPSVPPAIDRPTPTPLEALRGDITGATRLPGVENGVWGIAIHSLDRDERLYDLNPRTLLVPASTAKLVSAASAADAVGWDYRFQTTVSISGSIVNIVEGGQQDLGVLTGDLLITGSGDPTIGGRAGDDVSAWIEALSARGIRRIRGRVIGDDDSVEEPRPALAWAWDDLGYATGVVFGALNLAENRTAVSISPGLAAGAPATVVTDAFAERRPLSNRVLTGEPSSLQLLWPEQRPGEYALTIAGTIPAGAPPARLQVSAGNPTLWFASVLRARLIAAGIGVTGNAMDIDDLEAPLDRGVFTVVHVHRSRPLAEIVQPLFKDSINLYGEAVMRLNTPPNRFPTNDAALEGLRQRLTAWGIPPDGAQIVDGSGLSRRDVISAETLVTLLRRMHDPSGSSPWMTALPVAGVDGSLQARMRGTAAEGNVRAKTGTMSNVRSLAGYVRTREGERLAFAILVNNFEGTGAQANAAVDAIAVRLATFSIN
jgi:D-alanyl-D-alanine carboxypeptidase/D-alanyl-D-alanine-endopeptidase (penicillin-binding protein 4)